MYDKHISIAWLGEFGLFLWDSENPSFQTIWSSLHLDRAHLYSLQAAVSALGFQGWSLRLRIEQNRLTETLELS